MKAKVSPLPDLDDDEFTRRLKPLEAAMFSHKVTTDQDSLAQEKRLTGDPVIQSTGIPVDRIAMPPTHRRIPLPEERVTGLPDIRTTGYQEGRNADLPDTKAFKSKDVERTDGPDNRVTGNSAARTDLQLRDDYGARTDSPRSAGVVGAAERLAQIEETRGPKRRFEYLIPQRVGDALAKDALRQGKSATVLLLEVLRDAGYPVIPEDLIDLRKERRR